MSRSLAESHKRIKLIAEALDRLLARLRTVETDDFSRLGAEMLLAAAQARKQPELADWAAFLCGHVHIVERGGAVALLQAAVGFAQGSLVTLAAEEWVLGRTWKVPWLRRLQRPRDARVWPLLRVVEGVDDRVTPALVAPGRLALACASPPRSLAVVDLDEGAVVARSQTQRQRPVALVAGGASLHVVTDHGARHEHDLRTLERGAQLAREGEIAPPPPPLPELEATQLRTMHIVLGGPPTFVTEIDDPAPRMVAVGEGRLALFDLSGGRSLARELPPLHDRSVLALSRHGQHAVCRGPTGDLELFDLTDGRKLRKLSVPFADPTLVGAHLEHNLAIVKGYHPYRGNLDTRQGDARHPLTLVDTQTGEARCSLPGHRRGARCSAMHSDGQRVAVAGRDRVVRIHRIDDGAVAHELTGHKAQVVALAFHPDGQHLVSLDQEGDLIVFELRRGKVLSSGAVDVPAGSPRCMVLTPSGESVIVGGEEGLLASFRIETRRARYRLQAHDGCVRSIALTDDGAFAFSASEDRTMRLFRTEKGTLVARYDADTPLVGAASLDDDRLAIWGQTGEVTYLKFNPWGLDE